MISVLTPTYCSRPWTQRELDLFDLTADHAHRRFLAIQLGNFDLGLLDQVILVHQRILWANKEFDAAAYWKLYCGMTDQRPGPREEWSTKGQGLIDMDLPIPNHGANAQKLTSPKLELITDLDPTSGTLPQLIRKCLEGPDWKQDLQQLRVKISEYQSDPEVIEGGLLQNMWARGYSEYAGVVALALLPRLYNTYSAWPFLDLSCVQVAQWFLLASNIEGRQSSEIWFSWAVSQQSWSLLNTAAEMAPYPILIGHFRTLAENVLTCSTFSEAEETYDYGVMITPWNHFHLCWMAMRLNDHKAAMMHACALCSITTSGDVRTGRFLNRLTTWEIFAPLRTNPQLRRVLVDARATLGICALDRIDTIRSRLTVIWEFARSAINTG